MRNTYFDCLIRVVFLIFINLFAILYCYSSVTSKEIAVNFVGVVVTDKHPIYIDTVPCGEDPVDEDDVDAPKTEEEARQIMTTDSIGMARMYLERHPEILPELSSGEDAKDVAIEYIKEYDSKIK